MVARAVAEVAADRILASIGGAEPRMQCGESPTPRARAVLARLEAGRKRPDAVLARVAAGHLVGGDRDDARVLDVVVERAVAIVDFIPDPTRARRSDRVRDVEHSRAANPWADLQAERAWGPPRRIPAGIAIGILTVLRWWSQSGSGVGAAPWTRSTLLCAMRRQRRSLGGPRIRVTRRGAGRSRLLSGAMYDELRVVAVTVLVVVLGAAIGGWWTSGRGWPGEAVAVLAGALSVYLGAAHLDPPLSSLAVVLVGLGCLTVAR